MKVKEQFEIKGSLVIDRADGYSYNLTSRIDADHLCNRLQTQHNRIKQLETLQKQHKELDKKLDKALQQIINIQMTISILQDELSKIHEELI